MRVFLMACVIYSLSLVCSCSAPENHKKAARLTPFTGFPYDITGCSCYFSANEEEFKEDKYMFVSNLDSSAYISIGGQILQLKLVSSSREHWSMDDRDYQETYSDGIYIVVVNVRFKGHVSDEVWWNTGSIKLLFKEVEIETISFLGECGC